MIPVKLEEHPELTEALVQTAVADYVQWWRVVCVPNLCLFHEMDVAVLTRSGCLWEYEIKLSQSDWNNDRRKDVERPLDPSTALYPEELRRAWARPTRNLTYVERFHYVYAAGLSRPDWVPAWAGLLEVDYRTVGGHIYVGLTEHRKATPRRAQKPTDAHVRAMYEAVYRRYWRRVRGLPALVAAT